MWVPPESTVPSPMHAPIHKSIACFGAINLGASLHVRTKCNVFGAETVQRFHERSGPIERVRVLTPRLATRSPYFDTLAEVLPAANACLDRSLTPDALVPPGDPETLRSRTRRS